MHTVAAFNGNNISAGTSIFPFDMMVPPTKHKMIPLEGKINGKEVFELMNRSLTTRVEVAIRNKALNADIAMWLAAAPTDNMPATAKVVKANCSVIRSTSKLGTLVGTFLIIKNLSDLNEAIYSVEVNGLKKTKEEKIEKKKKGVDMQVIATSKAAAF